jgi:hypothetical protein
VPYILCPKDGFPLSCGTAARIEAAKPVCGANELFGDLLENIDRAWAIGYMALVLDGSMCRRNLLKRVRVNCQRRDRLGEIDQCIAELIW